MFQDPIALKSYASKQLKWLLSPLGLKKGEGLFAGWDYLLDKNSFFYTAGLLESLGSQSFSLSMLIDWMDMANMASLSSGNVKALKKGSGVKTWVAFIKVLVETIFLMIEEDPADWYKNTKAVTKVVKTAKKNPFVNSDSEEDFLPKKAKVGKKMKKPVSSNLSGSLSPLQNSDEDFLPKKDLPQPTKVARKSQFKKGGVVPKLKKAEKLRDGGADFNLELGLALSISEEEVRKTIQNFFGKTKVFWLFVDKNNSKLIVQERRRSLDHQDDVFDIDLSLFGPGRLSDPVLQEDQSLRVRGNNASRDMFSDFSSVTSSRDQSYLERTNTPSPPNPLPISSFLHDDLNLSSDSSDEDFPKVFKVQNVTSSSVLEGQIKSSEMNDVSNLGEKMKKRKVTKNLKPVPYLPPREEEEEGDEEEEDEEEEDDETENVEMQEEEEENDEGQQSREEQLQMCKKAGIKRGIMKTVFESYSKFRTPVNFQLLGKKKWENGQWKVLLSDGLWKHVFVMSAKYDYVMNKVRDNSILCLNQIYNLKTKKNVPKKKLRTLLVTNFFVPSEQQVNYNLIGLPKTLLL